MSINSKDIKDEKIEEKDIKNQTLVEPKIKDSENQEGVLNYEPLNFKDADISTYTLKINSKDRNYDREPNPFNFEIIF